MVVAAVKGCSGKSKGLVAVLPATLLPCAATAHVCTVHLAQHTQVAKVKQLAFTNFHVVTVLQVRC